MFSFQWVGLGLDECVKSTVIIYTEIRLNLLLKFILSNQCSQLSRKYPMTVLTNRLHNLRCLYCYIQLGRVETFQSAMAWVGLSHLNNGWVWSGHRKWTKDLHGNFPTVFPRLPKGNPTGKEKHCKKPAEREINTGGLQ